MLIIGTILAQWSSKMATIRKKGDFQWHVQIRRKHVSETKTFTKKADAEAWGRDVEGRIDRGVYVSRVEAESTNLNDACNRYERELLPALKGRAADASRLKTIRLKLGMLPLAAITTTLLSKFRDDRLKVVGNQSVIHELNLVNRVLKACVLDWGIALPSGVPQVRKPTKPRGRDRRVEQGEIDAIVAASESQELGIIIGVAIETAMRRSELSTLERDNLHFQRSIAHLDETKNGDTRDVPLSTIAISLLSKLPARINGKVFGMQPDSITQAFERAVTRARALYESQCEALAVKVEKAWLKDIHFHDLRHEATSRIADKVSNLVELASITGHKDLQMLKRYYHPRAEDLAKKLG